MKMEWIRTTIQKPYRHDLVIVSLQSGAITVGRIMNNNSWGIFTTTGLDVESATNKVTHWMPLPEPPIWKK